MRALPCPTSTARSARRAFARLAAVVCLPLAISPRLPAQATPPPADSDTRKEAAIQLSVFTVSEDKDVGYESMQTTSGMRTAQELKNVASSISIMNAQLIQDLAAVDIGEMSKWFVTGEESPDPAQFNQLIFRGIRNSFALRNGWIWYSPMDSFSTERVELLRGPNAFLYGEADLGGANNQVTKRGRFTQNINRVKVMLGDARFRRGELDFNRRLGDKLAARLAAVVSSNDSWVHHAGREFRGLYGAVTYRPFRSTTVSATAELSRSATVVAQGLFINQFSYTTGTNLTNSAGVVYVPATGAMFRASGMRRSNGPGITVVDPAIVPRDFQVSGPKAVNTDNFDTYSLELEQRVGPNLHLLLNGLLYFRNTNTRTIAAARTLYRDLSPTLPGGAPNPYFNELYTEYFRLHNLHGNTLRALRASAVYDLRTRWTNQQFIVNAQQQQDNPKHWQIGFGEYVLPSHPSFVGTLNPASTYAAFIANRATLTNNRFIRRFYLRDGDGARLVGDVRPIPGVSGYFPDLSNGVGAAGEQTARRFYTPSIGAGASGSYFKNHLFTLIGYRRDHFNMKTTFGAPRAIENAWIVDSIPELNAYNPNSVPFAQYKVDATNLGLVFRLNDTFAIAYNRAQSFRISAGDGNASYIVGQKQGMQTGEGDDLSARFSLFGGRLEFNTTHYNNYQPNARFAPGPTVGVRDELTALFPTSFNSAGSDLQTISTKGLEVEIVANLTRNWRLMLNGATNKVVTKDRAPFLKGFQSEARKLGQPTPQLDAFLLTIPEGVPTAGYTKTRANLFTRYTFSPQSRLKGLFIGGGANWRQPTFRGNGVVTQGGPVLALWSPSYHVVTLLAGYQTKVFNRVTNFQLNVSNLLDKDYYLSATTNSGSWGAPRSWRLTMFTDF